jgi:hypothetical protein
VEREMRQFMPEHHARITSIGSSAASLHNDSLLGGNGDRRAVLRRMGSDQFGEAAAIRRDEDEHARRGTWQPGKRVATHGTRQQRTGEHGIVRRRPYRESSLIVSLQSERQLRLSGGCARNTEERG